MFDYFSYINHIQHFPPYLPSSFHKHPYRLTHSSLHDSVHTLLLFIDQASLLATETELFFTEKCQPRTRGQKVESKRNETTTLCVILCVETILQSQIDTVG